jgi:hypothetical protein
MRRDDVDVTTVVAWADGAHRRDTWHDGELSVEVWTPGPGCDGTITWTYTLYSNKAFERWKKFLGELS